MREAQVFFIALLLVAVLSVESPGCPLYSADQLTEEGEKAYQVLLTASQFEGAAIGYGAEPSKLVEAYRTLLKESAADSTFKRLLQQATPAGQLYALCGLYFTDHRFFLGAVEKHRARSDYVKVQFGCLGWKERVSRIVEEKVSNVVRLSETTQSINDWIKSHPEFAKTGYRLDIVGGGYPSEFSRQYSSK